MHLLSNNFIAFVPSIQRAIAKLSFALSAINRTITTRTMSDMKQVSCWKSFGGEQKVFSHQSQELGCTMKFSMYFPPQVLNGSKAPVLYFLSGLTCTEENFMVKSGFQRYAATYGLIVVGPDTSPRGCNIEGEDKDWDFGSGAGFYVDATTKLYKDHYRMFSYVTNELPNLIESEFAGQVIAGKRGISGHSMGGHGSLICSLKNPGLYQSVSAFAPINNPSQVPWGIKAFTGYFGDGDVEAWKEWDATHLAESYSGPMITLLVDQGTADPYLKEQLDGTNFIAASTKNASIQLVYRLQDGYEHGYMFVGTFIDQHFKHHRDILYSES